MAIYTTIFQNKSKQYITNDAVPALIQAGLPASSVEAFLTAASTGMASALEKVPGVNAKIIQAGVVALTDAYAHAFKITWLATISFGGLAVIAACASRDIDSKLSHDVIRRLGHGFVPEKKGEHSPESGSAHEDHEKEREVVHT